MASSTKNFSLFLLLTLLSSFQTHARDSQFFNKAPTTTNNVVPDTKLPLNNQQEEPNFLPENENNYGLYGLDSGQLHPSTTNAAGGSATQPFHKYLPKNYNPVAYVTEPEDINESPTFTDQENSFTSKPENNKYYNYNGEKNYYYNGGSRFNSQPQGLSETRFDGGAAYSRGGFQPQGMSDTRSTENGKYFYDVNTEKYSSNHPYESLRGNRARNEYSNKNFYGNSENEFEFNSENSKGGYRNHYEFKDEENNLP